MRVAGKFTEFVFKDLIERVETIVDEQRSERHDQISGRIEKILDSDVKLEHFVSKKMAGK